MGSLILLICCIGIPFAFFVLGFVIGCFEKHPVRMFVAAEVSQLQPYTTAVVERAGLHGFEIGSIGIHTKYRENIVGVLLRSSDGLILVMIGDGKILNIPTKKTMLFSRFKDDGVLITIDESGTAELDPKTSRQILMNANFDELLQSHRARLQESVMPAVPFPADAGWPQLDELYQYRVDRMVSAGRARYVDSSKEFFRYTMSGSFRATIVHGIGQVIRPSNWGRQFKQRPG